MNITEFKYRYNSEKEKALVLYRQALPSPFVSNILQIVMYLQDVYMVLLQGLVITENHAFTSNIVKEQPIKVITFFFCLQCWTSHES